MDKSTIELRLTRLKTLMNSVDVPEDFTISYSNFPYTFKILKENLSSMEFAINKLLDNAPGWFVYYNKWYKVLSKIYLKENE